jgi:TonB family protein
MAALPHWPVLELRLDPGQRFLDGVGVGDDHIPNRKLAKLLLASLVLHIGVLGLLNFLEGVPAPKIDLAQEIPVELVTQPPPDLKDTPKKPHKLKEAEKKTKEAEKAKEADKPKPEEKPKDQPKPQEKLAQAQPAPPKTPPPPKPAAKPEEKAAETAKAPEPAKAAPAKAEPAKQEAKAVEPPKPAAAKPESPKAQAKAEPPKPETAKPEPPKPEPQKAEPPKPAAAKPSAPAQQAAAAQPHQQLSQQQLFNQAINGQPNSSFGSFGMDPAQQEATAPVPPDDDPIKEAVAVPAPSDDGDVVVAYKTLVFSKLELAKNYPEEARKRGARGSSVIAFALDDKGHVRKVTLLQSSGDTALDVESLALVERAAPFPPPPPGAQKEFAAVVEFGVGPDGK